MQSKTKYNTVCNQKIKRINDRKVINRYSGMNLVLAEIYNIIYECILSCLGLKFNDKH